MRPVRPVKPERPQINIKKADNTDRNLKNVARTEVKGADAERTEKKDDKTDCNANKFVEIDLKRRRI